MTAAEKTKNSPHRHFAGLNTPELHEARLAYLKGEENPHLSKVKEQVGINLGAPGADSDQARSQTGDPAALALATALEIPGVEEIKIALKELKNALTKDPVSRGSYYDDERTQHFDLPYNAENAKAAVKTLLAANELGWLDEPFEFRDPQQDKFRWAQGDQPAPPKPRAEGRHILERLNLDVKYPDDVELIHLVTLTVPATDPYWQGQDKSYVANNPEKPLLPHGIGAHTNIFTLPEFNQPRDISPEALVGTIQMLRSIHTAATAHSGKEDPLQLQDRMSYSEKYFPELVESLEKSMPDMSRVIHSYLQTGDLEKTAQALQKLDDASPGAYIGTSICSHYIFSQIINTDPKDLKPQSYGHNLKEAYTAYHKEKETPKEKEPGL